MKKRVVRRKSFAWKKLTFLSLIIASSCVGVNRLLSQSASKNQQQLQASQTQIIPAAQQPQVTPDSLTKINQHAAMSEEIPKEFHGRTIYQAKVNKNEKFIALTFDDGPWPTTSKQILDILQENNIKATFFVVGKMVQEHPDITQRIVNDGHAIANHTWSHHYHRVNRATAAQEIDRTADIIYQTTGVKTNLFRPPGGFLKNGLAAYAKEKDYAVMMWSVVSADTDKRAKPQAYVKNVLKNAKPGGIVLMHDGGGDRRRTVEALPKIISGLRDKGYTFVTIPELLNMQDGQSGNPQLSSQ
jgi:peptidoglycan/xylan/chitin deacetylase (PgdA/CDA1 family)